MAAGWLLNVGFAGGTASTVSAVITGSLSDGALENEIANSWQDLVITLTGATWDSDFNAQRQGIIDGLDSGGTETNGWNNIVRDNLLPLNVTKVTDKIARVDLAGFPTYSVDANETITCTIPAAAQSDSSAITATPTFDVNAATLSGTAIVNTNTSDVKSQYEISDRSGFKVWPGDLVKDGHIEGMMVTKKEHDGRHPQEHVRSVRDRQYGPVSPEISDVFISTAITSDDL